MKHTEIKRLVSSLLAIMMICSCFAVISGAQGLVSINGYIVTPDMNNLFLEGPGLDEYDVDDWLTEYKISKMSGKSSDGSTTVETYTYDDAGRIKKRSSVSRSVLGIKTGSYTDTYTYDKKGNLTKMTDTSGGGLLSASTKSVYSYAYDKKGNVISYTGSDMFGKVTKKYKYNGRGDVISAKETADGGTEITTNTYDSKGRMTKTVTVDGEEKEITVYAYDKKGNVIREIYDLYDDGKKIENEVIEYTYDAKGNLKKEVSVFNDEDGVSKYTDTYTYDKNGNMIKNVTAMVEPDGEKWTITETNKYDGKGRIKSSVSVSEDSRSTAEYTYDKFGNLTKEVHKIDSDTIKITSTEIHKYNDKNLLVRYEYVAKSSAVNSSTIITYGYNSKRQLTKLTYESSMGGSKDKGSYALEYDKNGNVSKETFSGTNEYGIPEKTVSTFSYKKLAKKVFETNDGLRLSSYQYTCDGKAKKPAVFIDGMNRGADFKVSYADNIAPGKAKAIITFVGDYEGRDPVTILFNIRPAKVTGLKASKTGRTSVTLTWTKVKKADRYVVCKYNSSTGKYTKVSAVTANKATIKNLKAGTSYRFCVKAVTGKVEGAYSTKLTVKTSK